LLRSRSFEPTNCRNKAQEAENSARSFGRQDHDGDALDQAIAARRPRPGSVIHHSDRGVQYACAEYAARLAAHEIQPSMSRVGNLVMIAVSFALVAFAWTGLRIARW
jgi:hypothetical protein